MSETEPFFAYILPSCGALDYCRACLTSFFACTPNGVAIVIDDATDGWDDAWLNPWSGKVFVDRYSTRGGLTRSLNAGFKWAFDLGPDYIVAGNSDVLFNHFWTRALVRALDAGLAIAGPLTNAPGATRGSRQQVADHLPEPWRARYRVTDDPAEMEALAEALWTAWGDAPPLSCPVNGFFMCGRTATWYANRAADDHVFPRHIPVMPSGRRNPTPLMTGQEDFLHAHYRKRGLATGVARGSYIFHYRSVSRGQRHATHGWTRKARTPA